MSSPYAYTKDKIILQTQDVSLSFDNVPILHNINVTIRDVIRPNLVTGQVAALLGPSGIGKTQLFRILAGMQKPTSGAVLVTEKFVPVHVGMVGVVAQTYPLFNNRTVLGNLMVAARLRGHTEADAKTKALEALEMYGLTDRATLYPRQLSGGQRQRVAIAQQILSSDHFLLMDEPFSGLDPVMKDKACDAILKLAQLDELNTVIVVTHDIASAITIADTVWLMGRVRQTDGTSLGATVIKEYDLIERGLAWHPEITKTSEFQATMIEIRNDFGLC